MPQILVTAGPDEGRSFALTEELTHVGRGSENQIVLTDDSLGEHQFSLVRRNGRFALYTPESDAINVDGSLVPAERWVWVPDTAVIHCGHSTAMVLKSSAPPANGTPLEPATGGAAHAVTVPELPDGSSGSVVRRSRSGSRRDGSPTERSRRGHRRDATRSTVAKFITDRPGDPLVRLGADGHLPELTLEEATANQTSPQTSATNSNPLVLYGLLTCSLVFSVGLLLIEPAGSHRPAGDTSSARSVLEQHYGDTDAELLPYQVQLRQALVAHARGDVRAEQQAYRHVLRMLNSADVTDRSNHNGLTGPVTQRGRASDDDLRKALQTLLSR